MKKILFGAGCAILLLLFHPGGDALAQNTVPNGDFELRDLGTWDLTGSNSYCLMTQYDVAGTGSSSWCWRRMPGTGSGNGGLLQSIPLIGGVLYNLSINIAYVENG
jgi:hypothetical protein